MWSGMEWCEYPQVLVQGGPYFKCLLRLPAILLVICLLFVSLLVVFYSQTLDKSVSLVTNVCVGRS